MKSCAQWRAELNEELSSMKSWAQWRAELNAAELNEQLSSINEQLRSMKSWAQWAAELNEQLSSMNSWAQWTRTAELNEELSLTCRPGASQWCWWAPPSCPAPGCTAWGWRGRQSETVAKVTLKSSVGDPDPHVFWASRIRIRIH